MVDQSISRIDELLAIRPITEAIAMEVLETPGYEHLEITKGEWVGLDKIEDEITTGEEHGWIEALLIMFIGQYVLSNKLGRVYPGDVVFILDGTQDNLQLKREPDVAFVAQANVIPTQGLFIAHLIWP